MKNRDPKPDNPAPLTVGDLLDIAIVEMGGPSARRAARRVLRARIDGRRTTVRAEVA